LTAKAKTDMMASMKAELIYRERRNLPIGGFTEQVIWRVLQPIPPCTHSYKYRLVYILNGIRLVGYDNERGKGDHVHFGGNEHTYTFVGADQLVDDFLNDVARWNDGYRST